MAALMLAPALADFDLGRSREQLGQGGGVTLLLPAHREPFGESVYALRLHIGIMARAGVRRLARAQRAVEVRQEHVAGVRVLRCGL